MNNLETAFTIFASFAILLGFGIVLFGKLYKNKHTVKGYNSKSV